MHYAYGTILFNSTWKLETSDFILLAIFTTANLLLLFYYYFAVYVMRHDDDGKTVAKLTSSAAVSGASTTVDKFALRHARNSEQRSDILDNDNGNDYYGNKKEYGGDREWDKTTSNEKEVDTNTNANAKTDINTMKATTTRNTGTTSLTSDQIKSLSLPPHELHWRIDVAVKTVLSTIVPEKENEKEKAEAIVRTDIAESTVTYILERVEEVLDAKQKEVESKSRITAILGEPPYGVIEPTEWPAKAKPKSS
jgi:hypothetical protein